MKQLLGNTRETFVLMKISWRRREDVFCLCLQKTSLKRLDQDGYIHLSHTSSKDVFKTSCSRPICSSWSHVFKTSCKNVFKTSSRRLQDALKTSSRHLQDVLQRCPQDVFKTYHQVKRFLLTSLRDVFNTLLRCSAKTVIYKRIYLGQIKLLRNSWSVYTNYSSFNFSLY